MRICMNQLTITLHESDHLINKNYKVLSKLFVADDLQKFVNPCFTLRKFLT